jgi:hypothetical protein
MNDPDFLPRIGATITNGKFVLNEGMWVELLHEDIAVVSFDCKSKYPEILTAGDDEFWVCADENASALDNNAEDEYTRVKFDMPEGWQISMFEYARYTIRVLLMRRPRSSDECVVVPTTMLKPANTEEN